RTGRVAAGLSIYEDWRLPGGQALGEARRPDLRVAAESYRARADGNSKMAQFLEALIARIRDDETRVAEAVREDEAARLFKLAQEGRALPAPERKARRQRSIRTPARPQRGLATRTAATA
ncbi:unnamed protein product, partial [marine sediment metagenome]